MPNSPLLGYAELAEAQAIPATASNLIDRYLEAFATRPIVLDTAHTDPTTATTTEGTAYLVPSGATGAWTGWADSVALRAAGAWKRILPREGLKLYSIADTSEFQYDGAAWGAPSGAFTAASTTEQLTGTDAAKGSTSNSVAALWEQGSDVASAGTISIGEGGYFNITGTTTITDIDFATDKAGRKAWVKFAGILTLTHNGSTLILPTAANITTAAGDTACFVSEGSDVVRCVAYNRASGAALSGGGGSGIDIEDEGTPEATGATTLNFTGAGVVATDMGGGVVDVTISGAGGSSTGSLIGVQIITATGAGTYTPTGGTNSIIIELVGGGGGGSGIAQPTGSNAARAASGSGGGYVRKRLTSNFSGAGYVVGAKGTGGSAGLNAGNNGSNTTFTDTAGSPTTYTAGGGLGGTATAATAGPQLGVAMAGGTATNGDVNIPGGPSGIPVILSGALVYAGFGGSSHFSTGATPARNSSSNTTVAGDNATGYGGGGSAGTGHGSGADRAGGNGSDGIIIIWEYA